VEESIKEKEELIVELNWEKDSSLAKKRELDAKQREIASLNSEIKSLEDTIELSK